MENKLFKAFLAISTTLAAQTSFAENILQTDNDDWYLNFTAGTARSESLDLNSDNQTEINNKLDGDFTASFGYKINDQEYTFFDNIRLEAEFSSSEVTSASYVMVNALYDIKIEDGLTPYIGVGAGIETLDNNRQYELSDRITQQNSLLAYQAIAGVSYTSELYPSAIMHVGYKYFATIGKSTTNPIQEPSKNNYNTQNIEAGVRLSF